MRRIMGRYDFSGVAKQSNAKKRKNESDFVKKMSGKVVVIKNITERIDDSNSAIGVEIWTDGACCPNPGVGGWAWLRCDGKEAYGGETNTTNNRMEMTAILNALVELPDNQAVKVYSDSQYCIKGLTDWRKGWRKKSWMKDGNPMINRDLWVSLEEQIERLQAVFKWVKGHDGNRGNERVDYLARLGRKTLY